MTPIEREAFLIVHGGDPKNLPYLYQLWSHRDRVALLSYLKRRGLTGRTLTAWILDKCNGEPIRFLAEITKGLKNSNVAPALRLGDNFF